MKLKSLLAFGAVSLLALTGCGEKGEKSKENVKEAVKTAEEKVENAAHAVVEKAEEAVQGVEDAVKAAEEKVEETVGHVMHSDDSEEATAADQEDVSSDQEAAGDDTTEE